MNKKQIQHTVFYTALFSLLAHGYRFLSMAFSGDAALISQADQVAYQISLGRFLQPVLWQVRGFINAPLTIGLFATAALCGAAVLIVDLLGLRERLHIALACGILAANETIAVSYATYLPWMDVYMIALFFAMAGVYVGMRYKYGFLLSPVLYCICLGLYQSYLQAASSLIILLLLLRLLRGEKTAAIWLEGVKACVSLVAGLLLYALVLKIVLGVTGVQTDNGYNTIGYVGMMNLADIPQLLAETYRYPFAFFARGADASFVPPMLTAAMLALAGAAIALRLPRLSLGSGLTLLFLLLIWPLGANFVAFISKGIVHPLMVYSFFFFYLLPLALYGLPSSTRLIKLLRAGACAAAGLVVLLSVATANRLYVRRDLEFYSTTSAMTRILERAEETEGYVPGETPVAIVGYLPSSRIGYVRPGFSETANLQGMRYTYAASYEYATQWYIEMILGYPLNLLDRETTDRYIADGATDDIPLFPDTGCMRFIDGILFIKLS